MLVRRHTRLVRSILPHHTVTRKYHSPGKYKQQVLAFHRKFLCVGERLNYARKQKGYTQDSLAQTIGVSRGVIFNLEKNKTEPQAIVINAVCQILKINKEWLTDGTGDMESGNQAFQSAKLLEELYDIAKELSEDEQLFLLDTVKALKLRLGKRQ